MKKTLKKRISHACNKDVYLLGQDADGTLYWLEGPSWDCEWYWGFGYVETYTNNKNPEKARDIKSHSHIDSSFMGKQGKEYIHNIYDSKNFVKTTFSEFEGWQLSELFRQFYLLKEMSDFCHKDRPGCHVAISPVDHGSKKDWYEEINKVMIPKITYEIMKILSTEEA